MLNSNEYCKDCVHRSVCSKEKDFNTLKTTTDDLKKLLENRSFDIIVSCRYYQKDKENIR